MRKTQSFFITVDNIRLFPGLGNSRIFNIPCISKFFTNLQANDRKKIASKGFGINEYLLGNWIHSLSVIRNIYAHFGYLDKREYTVPISFGFDSQ